MVNESEIIMEDIKVGDKLKIFCYKHDGTLEHTSEEAVVLENNEEYLVCGNGRTKITEKDGRSHMTNEPAVLFFYKNHWFNIIGQLKKFGLFYYCNIASPYIIDGSILAQNKEICKQKGKRGVKKERHRSAALFHLKDIMLVL